MRLIGNVKMNAKPCAYFAAAFCLLAAGHAKATVNQAGNLLWSADLPGVATDVSVTPVVISSQQAIMNGGFSWSYSGANFSGPANPYGFNWIWSGPLYGSIAPGTGLATTTNYLQTLGVRPITMTTPAPESYLGFLMQSTSAFSVTLYNGTTSLGEITGAQIESAVAANGGGWINIDVANGGTYTTAVFSETGTLYNRVFDISYGTASESIGSGPAPIPALAGTIPGFAATILGMFGLRRRSRRA